MENSKVDEVIYCFWTDDNPITPNRLKGLESMRENIDVPICFLDKKGIEERILPKAPLHPAYQYLSSVHKSDYLRCYFMHYFGGGYADIKPCSKDNNWKKCFDFINRHEDILLLGRHEEIQGIAPLELRKEKVNEIVVALGWMICRKQSKFTSEWLERLTRKLDSRYYELKAHPATMPFGGENYPLGWSELLGKIHHRLQYEIGVDMPHAISNVLRTGWPGFNVPYR